jgi:hypothetical protein
MRPARFVRRGVTSVAGLSFAAFALTAGVAFAASPVSGFVSGQILSVKGASFVVKNEFGSVADSTVSVTGSSSILEQVAAAKSAVTTGACVTAMGTKASDGTVDAERVTVSVPVKGSCSTGFSGHAGGGGGRRPTSTGSGAPSHNFSGFGNFGFASGSVTGISGSTFTVKGESGTTKVSISGSTALTEMKDVTQSAISPEECAEVSGTSSNNGATVKATTITLSKPTSSGCEHGFGGRSS